ncbi:hypothetical protein EK21DRAFT_44898, partial [Setomelanomma holmii]
GYCEAQPPRRVPTSRKTGFVTIRTDSTDTQAAFESDAFAVLMPTTRLPILDRPISPGKVASPTARAEAFKECQEKARQVRERNNSPGVKVPSKILSYDYASRPVDNYCASVETNKSQPSPAGSFPISPPIEQGAWTGTSQVTRPLIPSARQAHGMANVCTPRKPITITATAVPASATSCYRIYRADSTAGASSTTTSRTPLPASIKVHIKPKPSTPPTQRLQTEGTRNLYSRPVATSSTQTSRSPSPVKSMPNFTRHNSVEGDSIFSYRSKDATGAVAGATSAPDNSKNKDAGNGKATDESKKTRPKRPLTTRWPWLRPSGPRVAKPTTTPVVLALPAAKLVTARTTAYVDPFAVREATSPLTTTPACLRTPTVSRPTSPKKVLARPTPSAPVPVPATGTFDTAFAQIKSFTYLVFKICLIVYAVIAIWFVLDAVREAFNTIAAPFRVVKWLGGWVGVCAVWLWMVGLTMWEPWGFKIA